LRGPRPQVAECGNVRDVRIGGVDAHPTDVSVGSAWAMTWR
jgi:hypothetical protein